MTHRTPIVPLLLIVALGATLLGTPREATAQLQHVERDGRKAYDLYLPEGYSADRKWPMLVAFHWSTGRASSMFRLWQEAADRFGVILALPNSRSRMRWTKKDAADTLDMIVEVTRDLPVDDKRIYATGFSAGANFAYRMMATQPGLFRAVGPFGGRLHLKKGELDQLDPGATRLCIFHGTRDRTIKFKHAVRAANTLTRAGFDVRTRSYNQGHWLRRDYAQTMWQCLDRPERSNDS